MVTCELLVAVYGPDQGLNTGLLHCECGILATGPTGKSLKCDFFLIKFLFWKFANILKICTSELSKIGTTNPMIPSLNFNNYQHFSEFSFYLLILCQLKKDVKLESCEVSFIWGTMRTAAWEAASQIALRDCSKAAVGESQYIRFWWRRSSIPLSTHFTKGFLLVMKLWCHHEGI